MKILYVVPYVPTPIRVRPFSLIRSLGRLGHQVTVATLVASAEDRTDLAQLRQQGVEVIAVDQPLWRRLNSVLRAVPGRTPFQAVYSWEPRLAAALMQHLAGRAPDVVHVEHLRGARYGLHVKTMARRMLPSVPVVWDSVDCISHLFEQAAAQSRSLKGRLMTRLELGRTRRYEGWLVHQFDQVTMTSAVECAMLERLAHEAAADRSADASGRLQHKLQVVPNGVDLDYFRPDGTVRCPASLVFSGKMSYHANVSAAVHLVHDIMPRVWARRPDAEVWIVGKDPAPEVQRLASPDDATKRRVTVTGTVPDVRPYLRSAALAVAPVPYGAGVQNKVLEAMACGTAVVTSKKAAAALAARPERDLVVAEDADAFADAVCALLADPLRCQSLGASGRAYVELEHSWDASAARLAQVYHQAVHGQEVTA